MKKKLAVGILSTVLMVGGATAALGATDTTKLNDLKSLYQQMFNTQKQILQKEVDAGTITQDQAKTMQSLMDLRQKYQQQALDSGQVVGPGMGMRGGFCGANNGQPLTDAQIKARTDYMQERAKLMQDALQNGTFVPGGPGMGMGMHGGWGSTSSTSQTQGTTN